MFLPGLYIFYLVKIEDFRDFILSDLYRIIPCTVPPIDTITDVAFEYSIIANILLVRTNILTKSQNHIRKVVACVDCTRWLLLPWLVMYLVNTILLICLALGMFIIPLPLIHINMSNSFVYQAIRCLGFIPLILAVAIGYSWLVIR